MTTERDPSETAALLTTAVGAIGGSARPGQIAMAEAVARAVREHEHLMVQAGTGTGKSLGYLVPALQHAVATGRPVVVSTATLALQSQIVERDLPRLSRALAPALGRTPTWQLLKGRANYVCLNKVSGGYPVEDDTLFTFSDRSHGSQGPTGAAPAPPGGVGAEVVRARDWAGATATGDRDELVPGVSERAWRQVSVTAAECLGQRCPFVADCFSERARENARQVDLVVTNHALVSIDAFEGGRLLPEHELLVLDEAHELADRVTSVVSAELTPAMVTAAARRARRGGAGLAVGLEAAATQWEEALSALPEGRVRQGWDETATACLAQLRDTARELTSDLKDEQGAAPDPSRKLARAALLELHEVSTRLLAAPAAPEGDVVWVSRLRRPDGTVRTAAHVAPLSVAMRLRDKLFAERTVVLTSATLTVGGSFDPTAGAVGLVGDGAPSWRGLDVGSPFDHARQGILYVAKHLPAPGRDGAGQQTLDELVDLVRAAGGRALGLFSSRRAAETAAEYVRARVEHPVLCQGDDSMPALVRAFAEDARTCLFGTLSLWQGVDVPGPACQLVVMDRIPFPRPDDPLAAARQESVSRHGGNGFMAVAGTQAALLMAQGAGRLVRRTDDRGMVAVLDPRLATARYGSFLVKSLPPFWATTDRQAALAALRRIDATAGPVLPVAAPATAVPAPAAPTDGAPARSVAGGGHGDATASPHPDPDRGPGTSAGRDDAPGADDVVLFTVGAAPARDDDQDGVARDGGEPADALPGPGSRSGGDDLAEPDAVHAASAPPREWDQADDDELADALDAEIDLEILVEHFDRTPEEILARCRELGLVQPGNAS